MKRRATSEASRDKDVTKLHGLQAMETNHDALAGESVSLSCTKLYREVVPYEVKFTCLRQPKPAQTALNSPELCAGVNKTLRNPGWICKLVYRRNYGRGQKYIWLSVGSNRIYESRLNTPPSERGRDIYSHYQYSKGAVSLWAMACKAGRVDLNMLKGLISTYITGLVFMRATQQAPLRVRGTHTLSRRRVAWLPL